LNYVPLAMLERLYTQGKAVCQPSTLARRTPDRGN
jgi:hypothetical protein